MFETPSDLTDLQALIDRSVAGAGVFLRESFQMPEHTLSAERLVAELDGSLVVALATVTARGEPRVAPVGAFVYRGHFCIPTTAEAARARHVAHRPGVSLTHFRQTGFAVIVHGQARILTADDPLFDPLERAYVANGGTSVLTWGTGVYLWIEPNVIYSYTRDEANM